MVLLMQAVAWTAALADVPRQFEVWAAAGPEYPPAPEGWSLVPSGDQSAAIVPTPEESRRGYVVYARDPFVPIYPDTVPSAFERATEVTAFASIGEYEPLSFAVYALEDLSGLRLTVDALRSAEGGVIPADHLDVRVVRSVHVPADRAARTYRLVPWLLERRENVAARGRSVQFWVTLKVPGDAQPGDYSGEARLSCPGREDTAVALRVRVLGLRLPDAPIRMALSYFPSTDDALLARELVDLREHGLNSAAGAVGVQIASRDRQFGPDDIEATTSHLKRVMGAALALNDPAQWPGAFEVGHQIIFYWDPQKGWFSHWEHSPEMDEQFIEAVRLVLTTADENGWTWPEAYVMDEAGAHGLLEEAVYYYSLLKRSIPTLRSYATIGGGIALGYDEIGRLSPCVDFLTTNRFPEEIARSLVGLGRPYGVYNGSGGTPAGARFFFGFYGWKTGAEEILQWAYNFGQTGIFTGDGFRGDDDGLVYYGDGGPLPSLMFEAVREGIDDYRYADLLWRSAAASKAGGTDAQGRLTELLSVVDWQYQAIASESRTPPPHPAALRKWRWQVAEMIGELRPGADATPAPAPRPSPLDLPWAAPAEEKVTFGDELLPASDFEADMGPWHIEAWKEEGAGALDSTEAHSGAQSLRVDIPAQATSEAVTVVVWPTWGGGGLNLSVRPDTVYEFSAYVKLRNRTTLPQLRVNLPQGASVPLPTQPSKPDENGWQRVAIRLRSVAFAQPSYIALWLQSPGTMWVDDLSLREVIPPAVTATLDQSTYDGSDPVGVVRITVAKPVPGMTIRCRVSRPDGEPIAELTAPLSGVAVLGTSEKPMPLVVAGAFTADGLSVLLDPSSMESGRYEVGVEALDADGRSLGATAVSFDRVAGPFG